MRALFAELRYKLHDLGREWAPPEPESERYKTIIYVGTGTWPTHQIVLVGRTESPVIIYTAYGGPEGHSGALPQADLTHVTADASIYFIVGNQAAVAIENLENYLKRKRPKP